MVIVRDFILTDAAKEINDEVKNAGIKIDSLISNPLQQLNFGK